MELLIELPDGLSDGRLRSWLIDRIVRLDAEKRLIKSRIDRYDHGERKRCPGWRDRAARKLDHLKGEREQYRTVLSELNQRIRTTRALKNRSGHAIAPCQAFVALAERHLARSDYQWLWEQAQRVAESEELK